MKTLFILLLLQGNISAGYDIKHLRNLYESATGNEAIAKQLIAETKGAGNNFAVMGYYGAGKILMANYFFNPFSKLKSFNEGKAILDSAINSDKENPELRYLRLTIQTNAPSFLGYNKNISEDKLSLQKSVASINDEQLKTMIQKYLNKI